MGAIKYIGKLLPNLERIERKAVQLEFIKHYSDSETFLNLLEFCLDMRYVKSLKGFSYNPPQRKNTRWQDPELFVKNVLKFLKDTYSYEAKVRVARNWLEKCDRKEAAFYYRYLTRGIKLKVTPKEVNEVLRQKRYLSIDFMKPAKLTLPDLQDEFPLIVLPQLSRVWLSILVDEFGRAYIFNDKDNRLSLCGFDRELTIFFQTIQRRNLILYGEAIKQDRCSFRVFDAASLKSRENNIVRLTKIYNNMQFIHNTWDMPFIKPVEPVYLNSMQELLRYIRRTPTLKMLRLYSPKRTNGFGKTEGYFVIDLRKERQWKRLSLN